MYDGRMRAIHVPIKENSERVADKVFASLGGSTILDSFFAMLRTLEASVFIDSSSEAIGSKAKESGFTWLRRSRELDSNLTTGNHLLERCVGQIQAKLLCQAHITSPFLRPETIERGFSQLEASSSGSLVAVREIRNRVWFRNKAVNHDPLSLAPTQALEPVFEEANLYFVRRAAFIQHKRRVTQDFDTMVISDQEAFDIDTPEDLEFARFIARKSSGP